MQFLGLGVWELTIIVVIITLIFGVGRLPEIGGAMGKAIREFKGNMSDERPASGQHNPATVAAAADSAPLPTAPETREDTIRREKV